MSRRKDDQPDGRLQVRRPGELWIYFLRAHETGLVKIGITMDPAKRIRNMQLVCPVRLQLLGLRPATHPNEERELHGRLDRYRVHGEWFYFNRETAAEAKVGSLTERTVLWRRCTSGLASVWGSMGNDPTLQPRSPFAASRPAA